MLNLITGKTGNGKSLYAISEIEKRRIAENRPVYVHGIPDVKLEWIPFEDATKWRDIPHGSIIVFDECNVPFPNASNAAAVPEYIDDFKRHRKQMYDIYFITQAPTFLSNHVRKIVDVHFHLMRKFGKEVAVLHKWYTCKDDCDKNRSGSITSDFVFPKHHYNSYTSSEGHTIKPDVPFRYYLKFIIPVVVVALSVVAYFAFSSATHKGADTANKLKSGLIGQTDSRGNFQNGNAKKEDDPNYYYVQNTPRIKDLAMSMPKYDEVTKPKVAPVPAACISNMHKCECYTQQGTHLVVSAVFCEQVVRTGFFIDFDNTGLDKQQSAPAAGGENIPPMQHTQVADASGLSSSSGQAVHYVVPDDLQPFSIPRPHYASLQPPRL